MTKKYWPRYKFTNEDDESWRHLSCTPTELDMEGYTLKSAQKWLAKEMWSDNSHRDVTGNPRIDPIIVEVAVCALMAAKIGKVFTLAPYDYKIVEEKP